MNRKRCPWCGKIIDKKGIQYLGMMWWAAPLFHDYCVKQIAGIATINMAKFLFFPIWPKLL